jgi:hypothetical protein
MNIPMRHIDTADRTCPLDTVTAALYNEVLFGIVQRNTVHCSALQYTAVQY